MKMAILRYVAAMSFACLGVYAHGQNMSGVGFFWSLIATLIIFGD